MTNVNEFVNRLSGGGARPNQYRVAIQGQGVGDDFTFLCRTAQFPAMTIGEVPVPYRGRQIFVAGDRTYDPWSVTIFNDVNWVTRGQLEAWANRVQDLGSTTTGEIHPANYYAQASIVQLDRNDNPIKEATLFDLWPQTVGEIDLAYDTNDSIEEYTVTFRFNHMSVGGVGTP